jgi:hypothetical protein
MKFTSEDFCNLQPAFFGKPIEQEIADRANAKLEQIENYYEEKIEYWKMKLASLEQDIKDAPSVYSHDPFYLSDWTYAKFNKTHRAKLLGVESIEEEK